MHSFVIGPRRSALWLSVALNLCHRDWTASYCQDLWVILTGSLYPEQKAPDWRKHLMLTASFAVVHLCMKLADIASLVTLLIKSKDRWGFFLKEVAFHKLLRWTEDDQKLKVCEIFFACAENEASFHFIGSWMQNNKIFKHHFDIWKMSQSL